MWALQQLRKLLKIFFVYKELQGNHTALKGVLSLWIILI